MYVILSVLLYSSVVVFPQNCTPTFYKTPIQIGSWDEKNGTENTVKITGCIEDDIYKYVVTFPFEISIKNQILPALKNGAVSNIEVYFGLTITHNRIDEIREGAFLNLPSLAFLHLAHNHIKSIESYAFENLLTVGSINLRNNDIKVINQNTFVNLPRLKAVYLDNNHLKAFNQNWFSSTPAFCKIGLSGNEIPFIEGRAFNTLNLLEMINLENNKITYIHPDAFQGLMELSDLFLSYNQLTSFDVDLKHLRKLTKLTLHYNKLTYISLTDFENVKSSLRKLSIQSNPLQCSCMDELVLWSFKYNIETTWKCDNRDIYCTLPLSGETDCVKRSQGQFNVTGFHIFESNCLVL